MTKTFFQPVEDAVVWAELPKFGTRTESFLLPTTQDLVIAAYNAYGKSNSDINVLLNNWKQKWLKLCHTRETGNDYSAVAYICKDVKPPKIIIAHRGTIPGVKCGLADVHGIMKNQYTSQLNAACSFVLRVIHKMELENPDSYINLSITGHSLGGWLAQITTFVTNYLKIDMVSSKFVKQDAMDRKIHVHCQVFDSPGARQILQKIRRESLPEGKGLIRNLDISVYFRIPNIINTLNEHVGEQILINLHCDSSVFENINSVETTIRYLAKGSEITRLALEAVDSHGILGFVEILHSKYLILKRVIAWPLVLYQNWDTKNYTKESNTFLVGGCQIFSAGFKYVAKHWFDDLTSEICSNSRGRFKAPEVKDWVSNCISLNTFSKTEVSVLEKIFMWKRYFPKPETFQDVHPHLKFIAEKIDNLDFQEYQITLFSSSVSERDSFVCSVKSFVFNVGTDVLGKLPNQFLVSLLIESEHYIAGLKNKFLQVEYLENEFEFGSALDKAQVLKYCVKNIETGLSRAKDFYNLVRIKILHSLEKLTGRKYLFLKATALDKLSIKWETLIGFGENILSDIVIVVDGFADSEILDAYSGEQKRHNFHEFEGKIKMIWFSDVQTSNFHVVSQLNLGVTEISFRKLIVNRMVKFQGIEMQLRDAFPGIDVHNFNKYLSSNFSNYLKLVSNKKESILEVFPKPLGFYDDIKNYIEIGTEFSWIAEYQKFVLYGKENDVENCAGRIKAKGCHVHKLGNISLHDAILKFQAYTTLHSDSYVNLLMCQPGSVSWEYQFNPKLYQERTFSEEGSTHFTEENLTNLLQIYNLVVIQDLAGMGKSSTLSRLCTNYSQNNLMDMVIKIRLRKLNLVRDKDLIELISEGSELSLSDLNKFAVSYRLRHFGHSSALKGNLVFFLDGLDELSDRNHFFIETFFQPLCDSGAKIILSTRPDQEAKLKVKVPYALVKFDPLQNFGGFFYTYWSGLIDSPIYLSDLGNTLADTAKEHLGRRNCGTSFLGVPLHLRMLAEVYWKEVRVLLQSCSNDNIKSETFVSKFKKSYTVTALYEQYVYSKYEILLHQKFNVPIGVTPLLCEIISANEEPLQRLALSYLGGICEKLSAAFYGKNTECYVGNEFLIRLGIFIPSSKLLFIHRTFAEFYVAKFIYKTILGIMYPVRADSCTKWSYSNPKLDSMWVSTIWYWICYLLSNPDSKLLRLFINDFAGADIGRLFGPDKPKLQLELKEIPANLSSWGQAIVEGEREKLSHYTKLLQHVFDSIKIWSRKGTIKYTLEDHSEVIVECPDDLVGKIVVLLALRTRNCDRDSWYFKSDLISIELNSNCTGNISLYDVTQGGYWGYDPAHEKFVTKPVEWDFTQSLRDILFEVVVFNSKNGRAWIRTKRNVTSGECIWAIINTKLNSTVVEECGKFGAAIYDPIQAEYDVQFLRKTQIYSEARKKDMEVAAMAKQKVIELHLNLELQFVKLETWHRSFLFELNLIEEFEFGRTYRVAS